MEADGGVCGPWGSGPKSGPEPARSRSQSHYNPHLWSWALKPRQVAGLSLSNRVRSLDIRGGLWVELLLLRITSSEIRWFRHLITMPLGCLFLILTYYLLIHIIFPICTLGHKTCNSPIQSLSPAVWWQLKAWNLCRATSWGSPS